MISALHSVPTETWGERLQRARKHAGVTLQDLDEAFGTMMSRSTIHRLEQSAHPPHERRDRERATLVAIACGYNPAEFGLTAEDIPAVIDLTAVREAVGV